ncbi:putative manganese transport mntH domain protein [Mycobacterium xenopi 3993]|nr:putative manganese transport mntH domain protein [Mycobacterium xenopi 3993]
MAQNTLTQAKTGWYLLGPAFVAAIAYVDPATSQLTPAPAPSSATCCCG